MLLSLLGYLYFLVFAPRSAFSLFQFITYSPVNQCGNFSVMFSGGKPPDALPLSLTVLPFNSTPLAFVVPNSAWDNSTGSGSFVTPLPVQAGVALLASLDDAEGKSAALISDVIQVRPSADDSCLPTAAPAPFQLVTSEVSQCLPFTVSRNTSSLRHPIKTRGFIPTSLSFKLKSATYQASNGVDMFTYIMKVTEGLQVALLFDDGEGNRQVSNLLSVQGDRFSPSGCLDPSSVQSTSDGSNGFDRPQRLSRPAVIAISVSSSVIVLITLVLGILFIRRERRRLTGRFGGAIPKRPTTSPSPLFILSPKPSSPVPVDPVYPMFGFSSTTSRVARHSARSTILAPFTPKSRSLSTKSRSSVNRSVKSTRAKNSMKGSSSRRLADLDIEGLLEVASEQRAATEAPRGYPAASPHTVTPAPTSVPTSPSPSSYTFTVANPTIPRELSHLPGPDVPHSPLTSVSQDWFNLERPSVPTPRAAMSTVASRNGQNLLSSRIRPLPAPFPKPTVFALSKNSV